MTLQERLNKRIDLLSDFGISVDEVNDIICFHFNRRLDTPITLLKFLTKPRFNALLEQAQDAYLKHHKL
jgi:hypothetical protein